jgi:hypothetical protein
VIQAGQNIAYATITADADAPAPTAENAKLVKVTASAVVDGKEVVKEGVSLGELKLAEKPKVLSRVLAKANEARAGQTTAESGKNEVELSISPGETISAIVKVERNGFEGEIKFGTEFAGRNLPHGVYIDNIGLNGITLLEGESQREFFITAAKWVPETTRPFHLRADVEANQTSWPVILHVQQRRESQESKPNRIANSPNAK